MFSPSLDRFLEQTAKVSSVIAWGALAYAYYYDSTEVNYYYRLYTVIPLNGVTLVALAGSICSLCCAQRSLASDVTDKGAWLLALWCSLPFFLTIHLLNPLGRAR